MIEYLFGENLQSLRELNSLSRKELANKIGVTEQEIWEYENQNSVPEFGVVNDVKKELSVRAQFSILNLLDIGLASK